MLRKSLLFIIAAVGLLPFASAQYVPLTGSHIQDLSGAPLASGQICFEPTNNAGTLIPFRAGSGGQSLPMKKCAPVVQGAFSISLADSTLTDPQNVCYRTSVVVPTLYRPTSYEIASCLQPSETITSANSAWCTTSGCNLDDYPPNLAPLVVVQTGPQGPAGPTGATGPAGPAGSGSGTVNSGTAFQIAYYGADGTVVSGTNALPNGTLATTQTAGDNTDKVATDAFVRANAGSGTIPSGTTNQLLYYAGPGTSVTPLNLGANLSINSGTLNATGGAANCGTNIDCVPYSASTSKFAFVGDSHFVTSTASTTSATAVACDGTNCTITDANTYTAGQFIQFYATSSWSPACLNWGIAPVLSTGLSSTQFEVSEAFVQGSTGCTGVQTGTGGTVQDASYFTPMQVAGMPFFSGHGTTYDWGVSGGDFASMNAQYAGSIHPLSPAVTGAPGYLFIQSGANDLGTDGTSLATMEADFCAYWGTAHADNWTIVQSSELPFPVDAFVGHKNASQILNQLNNWLRAQTRYGNSCGASGAVSANEYWDDFNDPAQVLSYMFDARFFQQAGSALPWHLTNAGNHKYAAIINFGMAVQDSANFATPTDSYYPMIDWSPQGFTVSNGAATPEGWSFSAGLNGPGFAAIGWNTLYNQMDPTNGFNRQFFFTDAGYMAFLSSTEALVWGNNNGGSCFSWGCLTGSIQVPTPGTFEAWNNANGSNLTDGFPGIFWAGTFQNALNTGTGATPAINAKTGDFTITLSADTIPTVTNIIQGMTLNVQVCEPATGGPFNWTWPTAFHGATAISTTAGECSQQSFHSFNGTTLVAVDGGAQNVSP